MLLLICGGCQEKNPDILSEGQMEDLLYDYHMADGIVKAQNLDSIQAQAYIETIYDKYGINQHKFDENMEYYLRRANILQEIYAGVSKRIDDEARKRGIDDIGSAMALGNSTDTMNIWKKERFYIMRALPPTDIVSYTINCDTTYHPGDRLLFSMQTDFLYQDGSRNGFMILAVRLKNDSTVTRTLNMMSSSKYNLEVRDDKEIGFKQIKCYIMHRQSVNPAERVSTTMRLMAISNIKLILIHKGKNEDENESPNPNVNTNMPAGPAQGPVPASNVSPEVPAPPQSVENNPRRNLPPPSGKNINNNNNNNNKRKNEKIKALPPLPRRGNLKPEN